VESLQEPTQNDDEVSVDTHPVVFQDRYHSATLPSL
jgi:hypothetical protein